MRIEPLHLDSCEAVAHFLAELHKFETSQDSDLWADPQLEDKLFQRLKLHIFDPDEKVWVAFDQTGNILGVLGGRAKELAADDSRRTYLPPIYGVLPVMTMGIQPGSWAEVLPELWATVRDWLVWRRVRQPQVWLNACNQEGRAAWQELGFAWLMNNAVLQLTADVLGKGEQHTDILFRPATLRDVNKLLPLYIEELVFHANLPGSYWALPDGDTLRLARREIENFLSAGANYTYIVAEAIRSGELLGYMSASAAPVLPDNPNAFFFPPDRGVLQVAVIKSQWRGRGVGQQMLKYLLNWFYQHGIRSVSLSYDVRNPLSGPFWLKQGFKPVRHALICKEF